MIGSESGLRLGLVDGVFVRATTWSSSFVAPKGSGGLWTMLGLVVSQGQGQGQGWDQGEGRSQEGLRVPWKPQDE